MNYKDNGEEREDVRDGFDKCCGRRPYVSSSCDDGKWKSEAGCSRCGRSLVIHDKMYVAMVTWNKHLRGIT